jgi:hypothetical protein
MRAVIRSGRRATDDRTTITVPYTAATDLGPIWRRGREACPNQTRQFGPGVGRQLAETVAYHPTEDALTCPVP